MRAVEIYRVVEADLIHFVETCDGLLRICPDSLEQYMTATRRTIAGVYL
jgi:hypothetical protein